MTSTFISLEAFNELQNWMKYRESSGEVINDNSWLMRDLWDTRVPQGRGLVTHPKKLASLGIKRLIERAIWAQHLRKKLELGKKRHPYQACHCLRKWFKTRCEMSGMKPINTEKLMNHSCGISDNYYRITEAELLEDYLKAVDLLTINSDKLILEKQVLELKEKSKDSEYIIKAKLEEKNVEIENMKGQMALMQQAQKEILDLLKDPAKLLEAVNDN
jgi:hypothetical protein